MAAGLRQGEIPPSLLTNRQIPLPPGQITLSFSGGVADLIRQTPPDAFAYGDIGVLLGRAIRRSALCQGDYVLGEETIRATVIGAGCHSTQLSGSTVFARDVRFPLQNLPVLALTDQEQNLPTRRLAEIATEGDAFVITKGDAIGSRSCLLPVLLIGVSLFISGKVCGTYGIALSSLGMLAFVGATVSIDAFGPIADNAGGLAESCHLDESVRAITDKLDAVGNTTAAIGKGFAIGSAAFATVSLIVAYVGNYTAINAEPVLNMASYIVVAGGIIGGALIEYFSALLTDNTIESARLMADEGDRQLSRPGVLEGTVRPDYNRCIEMAARQALKKMLLPSVLALLIPIVGGFVFGVEFVGGLLIGATIVAIPRAIFMGNSGGAFDNAKKYIESGSLGGHGKGSDAHKASVVGDTVGDTRKDVVGVALDIFIKTMSTVANTLATVFQHITLIRGANADTGPGPAELRGPVFSAKKKKMARGTKRVEFAAESAIIFARETARIRAEVSGGET